VVGPLQSFLCPCLHEQHLQNFAGKLAVISRNLWNMLLPHLTECAARKKTSEVELVTNVVVVNRRPLKLSCKIERRVVCCLILLEG